MVHLIDVCMLLLVMISIVQGFFLKVVDLHLEVPDLLVFLQLKLLVVYLGFEFLKLFHHHPHLTAVGVKKVLLLISAYFLDNTVNICQLLIDHVECQNNFLSSV